MQVVYEFSSPNIPILAFSNIPYEPFMQKSNKS